MKLHEIAITLLVVGIMVTGAVMYITDLGDNNGRTADLSSINKTTENIAEMQNASADMKDKIDTFIPEEGETSLLLPYKFLVLAWSVGRVMWTSVSFMGSLGADLTASLESTLGFSLPFNLVPILTAMLFITVAAIIIYTFFKWKMED